MNRLFNGKTGVFGGFGGFSAAARVCQAFSGGVQGLWEVCWAVGVPVLVFRGALKPTLGVTVGACVVHGHVDALFVEKTGLPGYVRQPP